MESRVYRFSSALNILRMITDMLDLDMDQHKASSSAAPGRTIVEALDSRVEAPSVDELQWLHTLLPPQEDMHRLVVLAMDRALMCHECMDRDVFRSRIDNLYHAGAMRLIATQKSFMALVYAMLALGERHLEPRNPNGTSAAPPGSATLLYHIPFHKS